MLSRSLKKLTKRKQKLSQQAIRSFLLHYNLLYAVQMQEQIPLSKYQAYAQHAFQSMYYFFGITHRIHLYQVDDGQMTWDFTSFSVWYFYYIRTMKQIKMKDCVQQNTVYGKFSATSRSLAQELQISRSALNIISYRDSSRHLKNVFH